MNDDIDAERRQFLLTATSLFAGMGMLAAGIPLVAALWPSETIQAEGAPVAVDITHLQPGELITISWQKKPVWILRRTQKMIDSLSRPDARLRDPTSQVDQQPLYAKNIFRSINPEYLVVIGVCTHLGCIPHYQPNFSAANQMPYGGFYCPCHGSKFDLAGRVLKGVPAPVNLEIPPYYFRDAHTIVIGAEASHDNQ